MKLDELHTRSSAVQDIVLDICKTFESTLMAACPELSFGTRGDLLMQSCQSRLTAVRAFVAAIDRLEAENTYEVTMRQLEQAQAATETK